MINSLKREIFMTSRNINTILGGVGGDITTKNSLANALGISSDWISRFEIVGSDIHCRIFRTYDIKPNAFGFITANKPPDHPNLTLYHDLEGKVDKVGEGAFGFITNFNGFESESVTELADHSIRNGSQVNANYPNLIRIGNSVFFRAKLTNFIAPKLIYGGPAFLASNDNIFTLVDVRSFNKFTDGTFYGDSGDRNFFSNSSGSIIAKFTSGSIVKVHEDMINNDSVLYAKSEGATVQVYDASGNYDYDL